LKNVQAVHHDRVEDFPAQTVDIVTGRGLSDIRSFMGAPQHLFSNEVDNDRGRLVYWAGGDTGVDEDEWCSAAPIYVRHRIPQVIDLSNDKRVLTFNVAAVRALAKKRGGGRPRQQQQKQLKPLPSSGTLMTTTTTRAAAVARSTRTTAGRLRQHVPLVLLLLLLLLGARRSRPPCPGTLGPRGEETWRSCHAWQDHLLGPRPRPGVVFFVLHSRHAKNMSTLQRTTARKTNQSAGWVCRAMHKDRSDDE
jgi:hypothetical protein